MPTAQNTQTNPNAQTHWNNLSVFANELFERVLSFYGVDA